MATSKVITINHEKYYEYLVTVPEYTAMHMVKIDSNEGIVIRDAIAQAVIKFTIPIVITKVSHS